MNNLGSHLARLNLPESRLRFKNEGGVELVYDSVRKKFVVLTPEEWVRQNFIHFLCEVKGYPKGLMAVEKKVLVNGQPQRFDLLVYNRKGLPTLMAEFKAPEVKISQQAFDQVVRYNMALKVGFIIVSNGMDHFACKIDYTANSYTYLKEIPEFALILDVL
jgi:hypothetical protein